MKKGLLVIDLQNDYFPEENFPLWNTDEVLNNVEKSIEKAKSKDIPVILVQHVIENGPFFNKGTEGVKIHSRILEAATGANIVTKTFADSFHETNLEEILSELGVEELLICGMMTQNCVTHTAISKAAEKYKVKVLTDCCTTVNEPIHLFAIDALTTRDLELVTSEQAL